MADPDDGTVTNAELARLIIRLEGQLEKHYADHEQRLRNVEKWVFAVPPTFILAAASIIAAIVTSR